MHDIDEVITVLPMGLSGVKSEENIGGNRVYCEERRCPQKWQVFLIFPGEMFSRNHRPC